MGDGKRNQMTSIYYMLTRDSDHQWWALNASDHVHYHHAGGAVTYHLVSADGTYERRTLGSDVENGVDDAKRGVFRRRQSLDQALARGHVRSLLPVHADGERGLFPPHARRRPDRGVSAASSRR